MIINLVGDLLELTHTVKCHQVNCKGLMGSGIAYQIRCKYPIVYREYCDKCAVPLDSSDLLGEIQPIYIPNEPSFVCNLFGQDGYGRGKQHTNYEALDKAIGSAFEMANGVHYSIAFPKYIGCGLAGGDWDVVSSIIQKWADKYNDIPCYIVAYNKQNGGKTNGRRTYS